MNKELHRAPEVRTDNIVVSELSDELLLYCLENHQAYCLNKTAAAVYRAADGTRSTAEIAAALSEELKSPVTEELVSFSLEQLRGKNLLRIPAPKGTGPDKQSRREVIRKIGISTAVALPIVTMLVAPRAADAQSAGAACGDIFEACTGGGASPAVQGSCCAGFNCCPNNQCFPTGICPA